MVFGTSNLDFMVTQAGYCGLVWLKRADPPRDDLRQRHLPPIVEVVGIRDDFRRDGGRAGPRHLIFSIKNGPDANDQGQKQVRRFLARTPGKRLRARATRGRHARCGNGQ